MCSEWDLLHTSFGSEWKLSAVQKQGDTLTIQLERSTSTAQCTVCQQTSSRVHSWYVRRLHDVTWMSCSVVLFVHVRRFVCTNEACQRSIFSEQLGALAARYARRTTRVQTLFTRMAMVLGATTTAHLLPMFAQQCSADTLLRLVCACDVEITSDVRILGVDEFALRRGQIYATLLVDLERRTIIDVLPDRSETSFAQWLQKHPTVTHITRDRSEIYKAGARIGSPQATHIADRWHLRKNASDTLQRVVERQRSDIQIVANELRQEHINGSQETTASQDAQTTSNPSFQRRTHLYDQIQSLHRQGQSIRTISNTLQISRLTTRKYLRAPQVPVHASRTKKIAAWGPLDTYLQKRWQEGCHNARVLREGLKEQGWTIPLRTLQKHIEGWRDRKDPRHYAAKSCGVPSIPSSKQVSWWLQLPDDRLSQEHLQFRDRLLQRTPTLAMARQLVLDFAELFREKKDGEFAPWLHRCRTSKISEMISFAKGLQEDYEAVNAAVTSPWSNGQVEGQVNKVKLMKRQMYGRAGINLLRQRLLFN
jgi:transposase